ncbi:SIMPL domain-containing protein [Agromyces sp. MMS24-K17]|uniref:SIMPL domain-containing protein n=1 Tax=Agromyces sp. MMS24-K17 TaxID=3372850 RepID=UPI003754B835
MSEPVHITVVGTSEIHHPAERATLRLSVAAQGPQRQAAFEPASRVHGRLVDALRAMAAAEPAPITWWASGQLRTSTHRPWNKDGKVLPPVFTTATDLQAKFQDFSALADWAGELAVADLVSIRGIEWALTERTRDEVRTRVQRDAVESARRKAEAYAASLGLGRVVPLAIADPGLLEAGMTSTFVQPVAGMRLAAAAGGAENGLSFAPEDITLEATVHARFAATPA